ncbi:hypothetical protein Bbelb_260740 [Branchiostoma belcheri]|nr:hypothetical protein Bbelb_260740 [Branchiostoma belcheri]
MASRPALAFPSQNYLCKLCSKVFDHPKVLPCLHTFCRGCLENLPASGGSLTCPTCGQDTPLTQDGVQGLRDNTLAAKLHPQKDPNAKVVRASCTDCESNGKDASFYCFQCMKYLCVDCEELHRKEDALQRHELWIADNPSEKPKMVAAQSSDEVPKCREHDQVSVLYCNTCREVLCPHCVVKSHKLHDFVEITEARETELKRIDRGIEEAQFCLENQRRKLEMTEETAKKASEQYDTSRQQIQQRSQYLIQLVRESEEQCLKELEENLKTQIESTSGRQEELLDSYKNHIDFSQTLLAHGNSTEILFFGGCLADRLHSLKMKSVASGNNDTQSKISKCLTFAKDKEDVKNDIESLFGQLGKADDAMEDNIPKENREETVTSLEGLTTQWKSGRPRSFSLAVTTPGDIIVAGQKVLTIINGDNLEVLKTVDLKFEPKDVAYSHDNVYVTGDDEDDNIIVADCRNDRVSKFGRDGAFIKHVITKHDGLFAPMGVALSRDGRSLIVSSLVGGMPEWNVHRHVCDPHLCPHSWKPLGRPLCPGWSYFL